MQPVSGLYPVTLHSASRYTESIRNLRVAEANVVPVFDNPPQPLALCDQPRQDIAQRNPVIEPVPVRRSLLARAEAHFLPATQIDLCSAGTVDQHLAHRACCNREEMRLVLPAWARHGGQLQIRLMHEFCGIQHTSQVAHVPVRNSL